MATGTVPFRGESSGVIFHAILERAPAPSVRLNPDLPPKLEDIINKALEKDRNLRYQHASDMRTDLQRLKRDTDSGRSAAVPAMPSPAAADSNMPVAEPSVPAAGSASAAAPLSGATSVAQVTSSVSRLADVQKRRWWVLTTVAALVIAAGVRLWGFFGGKLLPLPGDRSEVFS